MGGLSSEITLPPFPRGLAWLNTAALRTDKQRGRPVLVEFWDFCRVNSLRTLPYLLAWHERYADAGLRVIGVHSPGYSFGRDRAVAEAAIERLQIPFAVVLENGRPLVVADWIDEYEATPVEVRR